MTPEEQAELEAKREVLREKQVELRRIARQTEDDLNQVFTELVQVNRKLNGDL